MKTQFKYTSLNQLGLEATKHSYNGKYVEATETLIYVDHVQKSGADVYFSVSRRAFTADNGKTFYNTFSEAYKSENW